MTHLQKTLIFSTLTNVQIVVFTNAVVEERYIGAGVDGILVLLFLYWTVESLVNLWRE